MNSLLGLEKRRTLVVGGGQGIGRASALHLARAGADVAVVDLEAARAEAVAGEVRELGVRAEALTGDVTLEADARLPAVGLRGLVLCTDIDPHAIVQGADA